MFSIKRFFYLFAERRIRKQKNKSQTWQGKHYLKKIFNRVFDTTLHIFVTITRYLFLKVTFKKLTLGYTTLRNLFIVFILHYISWYPIRRHICIWNEKNITFKNWKIHHLHMCQFNIFVNFLIKIKIIFLRSLDSTCKSIKMIFDRSINTQRRNNQRETSIFL